MALNRLYSLIHPLFEVDVWMAEAAEVEVEVEGGVWWVLLVLEVSGWVLLREKRPK